jgi:hypothetical protein
MSLDIKTVLIYGGVVVLTVAVTVFGSRQNGLVVFFGTTLLAQMWASDRRSKVRHRILEEQLATAKAEFVTKVGLPLLTNYYQLVEEGCPLFKLAAGDAYERTLSHLGNLAKGELVTNQLDEVFHYLEFLFRDSHMIRKIRAISSGEFDEWKEHESWWSRHYLDLHEAAFSRGAEIERIFVVASKQQEKSVQDVFRRNVQHHVQVKIALQSRISPADWQAANCLLFDDEHNEPRYALVAYHDPQGNFQRAVIYGDRHNVRSIADMYNRIEGIARPFGVQIAA